MNAKRLYHAKILLFAIMNGWMDVQLDSLVSTYQAPTNPELTGIFWKQLSVIWEVPLRQMSIDCLHKDSPYGDLCYEWRVWMAFSLI